MSYAHNTANLVDASKLNDKMTDYLSRLPADHPSDTMSLMVVFNTAAPLSQQHEQKPFLDEQNNPVDGVHVEVPMGRHFLARCSLDGLAKLSNDSRVVAVFLMKPVGPA